MSSLKSYIVVDLLTRVFYSDCSDAPKRNIHTRYFVACENGTHTEEYVTTMSDCVIVEFTEINDRKCFKVKKKRKVQHHPLLGGFIYSDCEEFTKAFGNHPLPLFE